MAKENQENYRILRRWQVENRTGLSRSTIYNRIHDGTFPRPCKYRATRGRVD